MTHITRRAERQVKKLLRGLPRRDRERLVTALLRPVPSSRCGSITSQQRHRLFHFRPRLRPTTRVCYATLNGPHVVILDVAAHDDFEEFVNNFTGSYGSYVPIKESRIVTQYATNGTAPKAPQLVSPPRPAAPRTSPPTPPSAPIGQDGTELLARLLLDSRSFAERKKATDDHIEKCKRDARDEAITKVEGKLQNIEGRFAGHAKAFEILQEEIIGLQERLTAAAKGMGDHQAELEAGLEDLRESLSSGDAGLADAIASCERQVTTARADVCHLEERLGDLNRRIEGRLGVIDTALAEDRTAPLAARLDRMGGSIMRLARAAAEMDARYTETVADLLACRDEMSTFRSRLAESDAKACVLEDQLTTLQRSHQEIVEQLGRERRQREQRAIKARLARVIDRARSSLTAFWRRRCGA
jgi:DNA repair ATPase RecN